MTGIPLGPEDGSSRDYDDEQFETLEDRIYEVDYDSSEVVGIQQRFEVWQLSGILTIARSVNAQKPSVGGRAFEHGVKEGRREGITDKLNDTMDLRASFEELITSTSGDTSSMVDSLSIIRDIGSKCIKEQDRKLSKTTSIKVKDSIAAEVLDKYEEDVFLSKGTVVRFFVSMGLSESDEVKSKVVSLSGDMKEDTEEYIDNMYELLEDKADDYISKMALDWSLDGITEEEKECLNNVLELVSDSKEKRLREKLDRAGLSEEIVEEG